MRLERDLPTFSRSLPIFSKERPSTAAWRSIFFKSFSSFTDPSKAIRPTNLKTSTMLPHLISDAFFILFFLLS